MLIDSHCHLPHEKYEKSLDQIIADASAVGVTKLINIGTSLSENEQTLHVSSKYPNIYSALAIYPHEEIGKDVDIVCGNLEKQLTSSSKVVAVGECGLDVTEWQGGREISEQILLFNKQLEIAVKHKLPVVIHNRGGDEIIFDILDKFIPQGLIGVAHCFSSTPEVANKYLERGFYISFAGMFTYPSRRDLRDMAKVIPLDRLLIETDAPYLPPQGFRGQVNEPKHVVEVAKVFAETSGNSFEKVAEFTYSNTCRLFNIKSDTYATTTK